jgi:hypothetical protein
VFIELISHAAPLHRYSLPDVRIKLFVAVIGTFKMKEPFYLLHIDMEQRAFALIVKLPNPRATLTNVMALLIIGKAIQTVE